jgi:hypothetical protein
LQIRAIKLNGDGSKGIRATLAMSEPMHWLTEGLIKPLAETNEKMHQTANVFYEVTVR